MHIHKFVPNYWELPHADVSAAAEQTNQWTQSSISALLLLLVSTSWQCVWLIVLISGRGIPGIFWAVVITCWSAYLSSDGTDVEVDQQWLQDLVAHQFLLVEETLLGLADHWGHVNTPGHVLQGFKAADPLHHCMSHQRGLWLLWLFLWKSTMIPLLFLESNTK